MSMNEPLTFRTSRGIPAGVVLRGVEDDDTVVELKRPAGAEAAIPLRLEPVGPAVAEVAPAQVMLPSTELRPAGKLYLVARSRGGLGATSFAVNLALGLREQRAKSDRGVALVDLDLQFGTVGSCLDMADRGGLVGLAQLEAHPDGHAMRAALQRHASGLMVLPAPKRPIPLDAFDAERMEAIVMQLLASHEAVVVDLPPALVGWIEPLLRLADRLFMVTDLAVTSVDCARRVVDAFREDAPDLKVEVVVAGEAKPLIRNRLHRDAAQALESPLDHWLPSDPKRARLALDRGEPLFAMAPHSAWARSIRKIVGQLA